VTSTIEHDQLVRAKVTTGLWRTAVVYQIYPRSFADSNGDGIGDLPGITSRVGYLQWLGVDAVWLSPFHPSALADGGYDIDDHCDVAPELGSLDDFDEMVRTLHAAGIKVIVDIGPITPPIGIPGSYRLLQRAAALRNVIVISSATASAEAASSRPTTGNRSSVDRLGHQPVMGSGTSTSSPLSSRISTGRTRKCGPTSGTLCASGPTAGWTDFGSMWPTACARILSEPYPPWGEIADLMRENGSHPHWDRDDVHEIYADWRRTLQLLRTAPLRSRGDRRTPGAASPVRLGRQSWECVQLRHAGRGLASRRVSPRDQQRPGRHDQQRLHDELAAGLP
jgi:alpha-glucosidase